MLPRRESAGGDVDVRRAGEEREEVVELSNAEGLRGGRNATIEQYSSTERRKRSRSERQ
jgi:hypothetical protein